MAVVNKSGTNLDETEFPITEHKGNETWTNSTAGVPPYVIHITVNIEKQNNNIC